MHAISRHGMDDHLCAHSWDRRADLDDNAVLRFACSKCGVLGYRKLSPREPIHAYPDGRTRMPEPSFASVPVEMSARRRFLLNPDAVEEWLERKAWREMLQRGDS